MATYLRDHEDTVNLDIDLKNSIVKLLHANWLIHAIPWLSLQEDKTPLRLEGIPVLDAVTAARNSSLSLTQLD